MSPEREAAAAWLEAEAPRLAEAITELQFEQSPAFAARFSAAQRAKCTEDVRRHLDYLHQAVAQDLPSIFVEYVGWAKVLLAQLGISGADLAANLECLGAVLSREGSELGELAGAPLQLALDALAGMPSDLPTAIDPAASSAALARRYVDALLGGRRHEAVRMVADAAAAGTPVRELYLGVFQPSLREVGRLWQTNRITVAHEHYCTAATLLAMSQLYPYIFETPRNGRTLVAACVQGDLHEIGIRMVADFFEMDGWDTHYLGANVPIRSVVSTVAEKRPDAVAVSATITAHVPEAAKLIAELRADPNNEHLKIIVGGYSFNAASPLAERIGADGHASQADEAVALANHLCGEG